MTRLQNTSNVQKTVHASTKVANVWSYAAYLQLAASFFCPFSQLFSKPWHLEDNAAPTLRLVSNSLTVFLY